MKAFFCTDSPIIWHKSQNPVPYPEAMTHMDCLAQTLRQGGGHETVWLLEHPPVYTAGVRAREKDLLKPQKLPVFRTRRGGEYTYHGPGQRIIYVILDLSRRKKDVRAYVETLELWLIKTLAHFGITGVRRQGRIGIWVETPHQEEKIAAIGIRLGRWITTHGISLNISPNLAHFQGIVPCGLSEFGVTSFEKLGVRICRDKIDAALRHEFEGLFGMTVSSVPCQLN